MISLRSAALAAAVLTFFAGAAPASACRLTAVPGWTDGTSVVRLAMNGKRSCSIGHRTIVQGRNGPRAIRTVEFGTHMVPGRGAVAYRSNRTIYRGRPGDRFAYGVTDRVGFDYGVKVHVVRR